MSNLIKWLPEIRLSEQEDFGSKAANLGFLSSKLGRTPQGFCLKAKAYFSAVSESGLTIEIENLARKAEGKQLSEINPISDEIMKLVKSIDIPQELETEIKSFYDELISETQDVGVAVRSSASSEDLPSASFAGQLESYLNIGSFPDLLDAIRNCWASLWSPRVIHYRYQKGIGQLKAGMAVIVQIMVPAQVAGVMFTANPINNSRDEYYIEAVKGLGESLVLGETNADRYVVNHASLEIISKHIVETSPFLDDLAIKRLANEGKKINFMYDLHQDVEWAYYRGEIFLLQTRPITTLEDEEPSIVNKQTLNPIQKDILTNVNERFPDPILPMDGIIAKLYYKSLFDAYKNLGFKVPDMDWTKVEKGLFPEFFVPPAIEPKIGRFLKYKELLKFKVDSLWSENEEILNHYLTLLKKVEQKDFPLEVTLEYLQDALKDFERALTLRYIIYIQYTQLYKTLSRLLESLYGEEGKSLCEDLVAGSPQITMELNEKLVGLASLAIKLNLDDLLLKSSDNEVLGLLQKKEDGDRFLISLTNFLDTYGDRELSQGLGGIATTTWREKPEVVIGMLKGMLASESLHLPSNETLHGRQQKAKETLASLKPRGLLKFFPHSNWINRLVEASKEYNSFRENSHYYLTQVMTVLRSLFLTIGGKLVKRGILDDREDIMYLTYFEFRDLVYSLYNCQKISKLEMDDTIIARKERQKRRQKKWGNRHIVIDAEGLNILKGVGASSGKVSGPCRIIKKYEDLSLLKPGEILVAQQTNPAWTPVFSFIGGVVVEYGGAISHAAIIAREYGIPAIMGIEGVTSILQDGEILTLDGRKGLVQREH